MKKIYIGTSGYNYKHWKGIFYPGELAQKDWLNFYSKNFNTVEINATFYRNFPKKIFEGWRDRAPEDFSFVLKGSRYITHIKRLDNVIDEAGRFFDSSTGLGKKLSVVLWQFPAFFKYNNGNMGRLSSFLKILPKDIRQAFEFRDESWFAEDVFKLLNTPNTGVVINDTSAFDVTKVIAGGFVYIRFHGPSGLYSSKYSTAQLEEWAQKIVLYVKEKDVYCYFNNDSMGYAVFNAKELWKMLSQDYNIDH